MISIHTRGGSRACWCTFNAPPYKQYFTPRRTQYDAIYIMYKMMYSVVLPLSICWKIRVFALSIIVHGLPVQQNTMKRMLRCPTCALLCTCILRRLITHDHEKQHQPGMLWIRTINTMISISMLRGNMVVEANYRWVFVFPCARTKQKQKKHGGKKSAIFVQKINQLTRYHNLFPSVLC